MNRIGGVLLMIVLAGCAASRADTPPPAAPGAATAPAPAPAPAAPTAEELRARADEIAAARSTRCLVDRLVDDRLELLELVKADVPPVVSAIAFRAWTRVLDSKDDSGRALASGLAARVLVDLDELDAARDAMRTFDAVGPSDFLAAMFDGVRVRLGDPPRGPLELDDVPDLVRADRRAEAVEILASQPRGGALGPIELTILATALSALDDRAQLQRIMAALHDNEALGFIVLRAWLAEAVISGHDVAVAVDATIGFPGRDRSANQALIVAIDEAESHGQGAAVRPLAQAIRATTTDVKEALELLDQALERGDDAEAALLDAKIESLGGPHAAWRSAIRAVRRGTLPEALAAIDGVSVEQRSQRAELAATLWARQVADGFTAEADAALAAAWCTTPTAATN